MKRRLRKKKRIEEFQELGFGVRYSLREESSLQQRDAFLWDFLEHAIEANELLAGGGGGTSMEFFVVSAGRRQSATEEQRRSVERWLAARPEVIAVEVQPLQDAWHGWDK